MKTEIILAVELLDRKKLPMVLKPKVRSVNFSGISRELPEIFVVRSIYNSSGGFSIGYSRDNKENTCYIPENFEFVIPSQKELAIAVKDNLKAVLEHNFLIGCDPEIFVEDLKGVVIPAFDFLGSKKKPSSCLMGTTAYWDGFQAEFTTYAGTCLDYQREEMHSALETILKNAQDKFPGAKLSAKTVMEIPEEMLKNAKDVHVEFGCSPSLNAYGLFGRKEKGRLVPFRPAGGHMHFGIDGLKKEDYIRIVKALDAILGVATVSLFANFDDPRRRQLYGLPGEYRLPKHGLEYRVLSNAWLFHPLITNIVWDLARKVVMVGKLGLLDDLWEHDEKETIRIITECDVKAARKQLTRNRTTMVKLLDAAYYRHPEAAYRVFRLGAQTAVKNFTDVENNWDDYNKTWEENADDVKAKNKIA